MQSNFAIGGRAAAVTLYCRVNFADTLETASEREDAIRHLNSDYPSRKYRDDTKEYIVKLLIEIVK